MEIDQLIKRINNLARKKREERLTPNEEKTEETIQYLSRQYPHSTEKSARQYQNLRSRNERH
ncbi:MAG: hypothetical protein LUD41_03850 [Phascolarctobacterium sp.]|nr:hypothetical protein [Phascolarctobacterium sp.]